MKAILVIDEMPSDCNHCQFADFSNGQWECNQHEGGRISESMRISSTPSWCPLQPMPKKMIPVVLHQCIEDEYLYQIGWNACLKEIEGD